MDIASLSTYMSQADLKNSVGTSVLAKSLDMTQQIGDAITKIMDSSSTGPSLENLVTPYLGSNIDTYA